MGMVATIIVALTLASSSVPAPQSEPTADPVQVIKNHIDAYNRRDLDGVVATYAPDAKLFILPGAEPVYAGRDAIRGAYGDQLEDNCLGTMLRECPDLNTNVVSWQTIGSYVVTYQLVTLVRGDAPIPYVLIYEVRDGMIRNAWFLVDA